MNFKKLSRIKMTPNQVVQLDCLPDGRMMLIFS